jgi:hypothetical protein
VVSVGVLRCRIGIAVGWEAAVVLRMVVALRYVRDRWWCSVRKVGQVDPISMIVGALAAGAATGLTDNATSAVKDAYAGLRELVRRRFAARPAAEMALIEHEKAPEVWQAPLTAALETTGAGGDEQIIEAARRVLTLVEDSGIPASKYLVDLRGSQGVQVGDHNEQVNTFTRACPVDHGTGSRSQILIEAISMVPRNM